MKFSVVLAFASIALAAVTPVDEHGLEKRQRDCTINASVRSLTANQVLFACKLSNN